MSKLEPGVYQLRITYTAKDGSYVVDYAKCRCYEDEDIKNFSEGIRDFHKEYAASDIKITHVILGGPKTLFD